MKLALALAALILAAPSPAAWAQGGINLFWNDCSETGQNIQTFACNTNAGFQTLVVSVVPPQDVPQLSGVSAVVWVKVAAGLPPWWLTLSGQCRQNAIACTYDPVENSTNCPDIWQGTANLSVFGIGQNTGALGGNNNLTLSSGAAVPAGSELNVVANGTELYVCKFLIYHSKTTGTGSCAGCEVQACLVLNECKLIQPPGVGDFALTNPAAGNFAVWQGESSLPCPESTPSRNRTWGAVKELYR